MKMLQNTPAGWLGLVVVRVLRHLGANSEFAPGFCPSNLSGLTFGNRPGNTWPSLLSAESCAGGLLNAPNEKHTLKLWTLVTCNITAKTACNTLR